MKKIPICHIIGGGLSGLACAWFLKKSHPDFYSVIYEAEDHLGGRACSEYDDEWNMYINNASHLVLHSDKFMRRFVKDEDWRSNVFFTDAHTWQGGFSLNDNMDIMCRKICNTDYAEISDKIKLHIHKMFHSGHFNSPKFYSFNRDITQRVINVLAGYADEVHCGCRLTQITSRKNKAVMLHFGSRTVKINPQDKVVLALSNSEAVSFLDLPLLEYNSSVNILYYTSQTIFFPQGVSFVGIRDGVADWIAVSPNIISALVCNYEKQFTTYDKLALHVWEEIAHIRGVNSAFMPSYRLKFNHYASIRLNEVNNSLRPDSAETKYDNVFVCGDWTMKNYPCTLESAALSSSRAITTMFK